MLSKSFKAGKCKTSLKMATARIKLLRNKREVQMKGMRRELAQLLESGQEQTARIRVEHVIREEKTMSAYDLIELYCELIAARLPIIESQKSCPIDLKEAISSVIFASPRCADIPELMDIRKHFIAKYGKEFTNSALEVRPDCGVSRLVVEKLSARAPDVETKIKVLTSIAQEHNVKWDSKAFEEQVKKPNDDLLNGPSILGSKMGKESYSVNYMPATNQTKESSSSQNAASIPASVGTFPYTDSQTSSTSEPFRFQPEPRAAESNAVSEVESSYRREENASSNHPTWNMEFKDATSAAQAAAESAERASIAARAAAELATRESFSRQNSSGSNASSTYRVKNERPDTPKRSKLKDEDIVKDVLPAAYVETKKPQEMQSETPCLQREVRQEVFRGEPGDTNDGYPNVQTAARCSSSYSSQTNVNDSAYDHDPQMSSASETMGHDRKNAKHDNAEYGRERVVNYSESASFAHSGTFDDESTRYPDYGNNVVFDDYGSGADDDHDVDLVFRSSKELSHFSHQGEESSVPHSSIELASPKQYISGPPSKNNSSRVHLFTEHEKFPEKTTQVFFPPQFDENVHATFDDSDGLNSESEDEKDNPSRKKTMRPSNSLHNGKDSGRNLFTVESGNGLNNTSLDERKEAADNVNRSESPRRSGGDRNKHETKSYGADIFRKETGSSSSLVNWSSSRIDKAASNSYDLKRGLDDDSSDEEEQPLRSLNVQSTKKTEANEQLQLPSLPLHIDDTKIPSSLSDDSGQGLNYGRLTGGFKNRGFPRLPYVRNSATNDSCLSKQASSETYTISEKPTASEVGKLSAVIDFLDQESDNQELQPKAKVHISKISESSVDSHSMLHDEKLGTKAQKKSDSRRPVTYSDLDDDRAKLDSDFTSENRASVDVKLSRRTRGVPSDRKSSVLKSTGRSEMESKSSQMSSIASESDASTAHDVVNIHKKDDSKPLHRNLPQPTTAPRQIPSALEESPKVPHPSSRERVAPANNENIKSPQSSDGSASHEISLKKAPHTHPKLPDYDSIAARFKLLRSNRE